MPQKSNLEDDELNLSELFAALWSHKLLITLFTGLSIFLAGYHAVNTEKKFTASTIFQIREANSSSGLNISGDFATLATLAGLSGGGSASNLELLLERAIKREFILDMKRKVALDSDPYFNTYDPNYKDPFWKATIKKILGWEKSQQDKKFYK